jgi:hypothetical protein
MFCAEAQDFRSCFVQNRQIFAHVLCKNAGFSLHTGLFSQQMTARSLYPRVPLSFSGKFTTFLQWTQPARRLAQRLLVIRLSRWYDRNKDCALS